MPAAGSSGQDVDDELVDDELVDDELESEIELVSDLVVAATSSDGPLDQDQVDKILGVSPKPDRPATKA